MNDLPELSRLEQAAMMIGISDAQHRRHICGIEQETRLHHIWHILFGTTVARLLAHPKLEALRDLAMGAARGKGLWAGRDNSWERLDPRLLLAARLFLSDRGFLDIKSDLIAARLGAFEPGAHHSWLLSSPLIQPGEEHERMDIAA